MSESTYATAVSVSAARELVARACAPRIIATESVSLELALGRRLAQNVVAPRDVPGFANSAMDGFALDASDLDLNKQTSFRLVGEAFAGGPPIPTVCSGECVRIMTGAALPGGCNTVVMKEVASVTGDVVTIPTDTRLGSNVRKKDDDFRAGEAVFDRGTLLNPAQVGVLASFGMPQVEVFRKLRAVLLTTGDELVAVTESLSFGQIYDSNRFSLGGLIVSCGMQLIRSERVGDHRDELRAALLRAAETADVVISSGGVSAGDADFLPGLMNEIGRTLLWKVRMRPGMPFLCGEVGPALVFSLPGNPVSGMVTFLALVAPALVAAGAARPPLRARLVQNFSKRHARTEFVRCTLSSANDGSVLATPVDSQGSGMLKGMAQADALMIVEEDRHELAAGSVVELLTFHGWPAG